LGLGFWDIGAYEFLGVQTCNVPRDCNVIACQIADCVSNECVYSNVPKGQSCDNNLWCDGDDFCQAGQCISQGRDCSDPFSCTADSCDEVSDVCVNSPQNSLCDDSNSCTIDSCIGQGGDPTTGCSYSNEPSGTSCRDPYECTINDQCDDSGSCQAGTPDNNICIDNFPQCTNAICDPNLYPNTGCGNAGGECTLPDLVGHWKFDDDPTQSFDEETEILTDEGWKLFRDLERDEKVLTLNQETMEEEWQLPDGWQDVEHDGEMYRIVLDDRSEFLVSPAHRVFADVGYYIEDTLNPSSFNVNSLPSNSLGDDFSLNNLENSFNKVSGFSCGILSQITENICFSPNSRKSSSLVTNTRFSDLENSASLPFESPLGFEIASYPSEFKNFNNSFFTFSSNRNLIVCWDDLVILAANCKAALMCSFVRGVMKLVIISSTGTPASSISRTCQTMILVPFQSPSPNNLSIMLNVNIKYCSVIMFFSNRLN